MVGVKRTQRTGRNGEGKSSGSEAGSCLRLIDFVSLNSRLESNKEEGKSPRANSQVEALLHRARVWWDLLRIPARDNAAAPRGERHRVSSHALEGKNILANSRLITLLDSTATTQRGRGGVMWVSGH